MSDVFTETQHTTTLKFGPSYDAPWLVLRHASPNEVIGDLAKVSNSVKAAAATISPLEAVALAAREAQAAWAGKPTMATTSSEPVAEPASPKPSDDPFGVAIDLVKSDLGGTVVTSPDDWGSPPAASTAPAWGGAPSGAAVPATVPSCKHGPRVKRSGSTNGRDWQGLFCRLDRKDPENCGTLWVD